MKTLAVGPVSAVCLIPLLLAVPCRAQTTGSIRGVVSAEGTPLPGAVVEGKSPNLQGSRTATTDGEGRFTLTLLPPGTYTITATLEGFTPVSETVLLALNASESIKLQLKVGHAETLTVTAEAVGIEAESTTVGRNLDSKVFQSLPTGRNYADVVQLNSGIGTDPSDSRNTAITVYGATGLENAYLVDGVNTTGVEFGSQGKVLNFEFVQEVEFKSGGYEAEYGHAVGGILNVVTKSGGNQFRGDAFGYLNRDSFQAGSKHLSEITAQGVPTGFTKADYGADLGGYLLKDRLWFFSAYDRVTNNQNTRVAQGPNAGQTTALRTTSDLYSGKLTWNISQGQTVIGTIFGDPTKDTGAIASPIGPPTTFDGTRSVGGTDFSLRYDGLPGSLWIFSAQAGRHHEDTSDLPGPGGNQIRYEDHTGSIVTATGGFGDNGQYDTKKFTRQDYSAEATRFLGNHDVKAGFEYEHITAQVVRSFSGGQLVQILAPLASDPQQRTLYSHIFFASNDSTLDHIVSAPLVANPNHDVLSAFLQDNWRVFEYLRLNAGVRYEKQIIRGLGNKTYINIDHFSPRVGFTWDFLKDGKTKLFGSYGHFVEAIPLDMNIRSLNGERDATIFNFDPVSIAFDPVANTPDTPSAIKGTAVNDIDPRLKSQYQSEIILGLDRQIGSYWTVGVHGIYRSLERVIEDTFLPSDQNYAFFNPGDSVLAPGYPKARRFFRGIEAIVQKRLADHWLFYGSYLYSQLKGNYDGGYREIGGFNAKDPNITDDFDFPEFVVNSYGNLTIDRPHQVKAQVAYIFPFNLTLALSGFYISGTPLSRIGWWNAYGGPELFLTQRGTEGHSPSLTNVDAHVDYTFHFEPVTIHLLGDVFNVMNRQSATVIDQVWAFDQAQNALPYPTNSHYLKPNAFQRPRTLRVGLRVSI